MRQYRLEVEKYIKTWYYIGFVILVAMVGYGYAAAHMTVNVDSIAYYTDYLGLRGDLMRSGRIGTIFWTYFFGHGNRVLENTWSISVIGLVLLIWAGIHYCILFQKASGNTLSMLALTVFSACFLSYPLMNEIWGYQGAIINVCGGHLVGSFALLLIYGQLEKGKFHFWSSAVAVGLMIICFSSFESYVTVYIFLVFALLFLQEVRNPNWKKHLIQGLWYCAAMVAGLVVMVIVRKMALIVLHLTFASNGATQIYWLMQPFGETLKSLVLGIFNQHILTSVLYFPLMSTAVCCVIMALCGLWQLLHRRWFSALLVLGMLASLELLSIFQGTPAPFRACPAFGMIVAFVAMMAANILRWRKVVPLILCLFCLQQSVYMNKIFTLNHLRYEQEVTIIHDIGGQLRAKHDLEKPVVFVGNCQLGNYVMEQALAPGDTWGYRTYTSVREQINDAVPGIIDQYEQWYFPQTNVQSVINWAVRAFDTQKQMQSLFDFFGYRFTTTDDFYTDYEAAQAYIQENNTPSYPREGYIVELEDRILVHLG